MQKKNNRDQEGRQNYMKKIIFLFIGFIAYCAAAGNSTEPLAASKQAPLPNQPPEAVSQIFQTKLGQVRAILSEIQDLLAQESKILAVTREQKEETEKSESLLAEHKRAADAVRQEIKNARDQVKNAERQLAARTKQMEHCNSLQVELKKAQKERLDAEANTRQAEDKLLAAQKSLAELKGRLTETMKRVNDAKMRPDDLKNDAAVLETERARREEALTRAEKAVAMAEKAERERLLLASRLAELEQNLPSQQQNSSEQARIQSEIANERKALVEIEDRIVKEGKSREETENTIAELKKQLAARKKAARARPQKEDNIKRLQVRLGKIRERRIAADEQLRKLEEKLRESKESFAVVANMIAADEEQQGKDRETANAIVILTDELKNETTLMNEVTARIDKQSRDLKALEDEKGRLNASLILVKEKLGREEQNINKLDETKIQIAEQKKIRADMETRLLQITREQNILEKENKQLNQALIEAGSLILKNEKDFQKTERVAGELQKEKELARKSDGLLREKEESVKQLADEKTALQNKLKDTQAKLAQQNERTKDIEEKRRALDEEKKTKLAPESSGKDVRSVEQDILDKARAGGIQPSGQDTGADQTQEKKVSKQTGSRDRQNQLAQAEEHYALGIQKWDENDLDGAVAEFKKTIRLDPDAAGAYYNSALAYLRQGKKKEACDYAYQAGECYLRTKNPAQAARMAVLLTKIDQNSPLILKLRSKIAGAAQ